MGWVFKFLRMLCEKKTVNIIWTENDKIMKLRFVKNKTEIM